MMDLIAIGKIYGSHGVRGHLKVGSLSGEFEHFRSLKTIQLRSGDHSQDFVVEEVRIAQSSALLKLRGIESPEAARAWRRGELWVPRENACPLSENEYYAADLHGLQLVYQQERLGTVISVWDNAAADLLEIERPDGERQVVPFIEQFIGDVNLAEGYVELKQRWVLE